MRIRNLQTYISVQKMLQTSSIATLKNMKVGVDAAYWLRTLTDSKDPYAEASGGQPDSLFQTMKRHLMFFIEHEIELIFVFQGVEPRVENIAIDTSPTQIDEAWNRHFLGETHAANNLFARTTSRLNDDVIHNLFNLVKSLNIECMYAPYLSTAQLAYYADRLIIDAVIGPPSLILFGVKSVVLYVDFKKKTFDWISADLMLQACELTHDRLIEACIMAGTDTTPTFPYLNMANQYYGCSFSFGMTVDLLQNARLKVYLAQLSGHHHQKELFDSYMSLRAQIAYPVVLTVNGTIDVFSYNSGIGEDSGAIAKSLPSDFGKLLGNTIPLPIYAIQLNGLCQPGLVSALTFSRWYNKYIPIVETREYEEMLVELFEEVVNCVGVIVSKLPENFSSKMNFVDMRSRDNNEYVRKVTPTPLPCWDINEVQIKEEKKRQNRDTVDLYFVIQWVNGQPPSAKQGGECDSLNLSGNMQELHKQAIINSHLSLSLLYQRRIIDSVGNPTVFSSALAKVSEEYLSECMLVLELMQSGMLTGENMTFTGLLSKQNVKNPEISPKTQRDIQFISRIFSLIKLQTKPEVPWGNILDYDLSAYHCIVTLLRRTLRYHCEACIAQTVLGSSNIHETIQIISQTRSRCLPDCQPSRNCLGIVIKWLLLQKSSLDHWEDALQNEFPAAASIKEDLQNGYQFWKQVGTLVDELSKFMEISKLVDEFKSANTLLETYLHKHGCFNSMHCQTVTL